MKRHELLIETGPLAGRRFAVSEGGVRLGRSSSNDIMIPDEELSRNHCLFEVFGEESVRVTDLASANGTTVNGRLIENVPVALKPGDVIEVGATTLRVVGEEAVPAVSASVDLGLGGGHAEPGAANVRRRSPLVNALWGVVVLVALTAICLLLMMPSGEPVQEPTAIREETPKVREVFYEKVEATLQGVYRYVIGVSADGSINVTLDDTKENRHPTVRPRRLDEKSMAELDDILSFETLRGFDPEYAGPEPEPQALNSWRLKVVYTTKVVDVRIVNTQEPDTFRNVREKLETFANNELGVHALRYSRDKLVALAEEQISVGRVKWEDREVQHGNLFASVSAYREAIFYLETLEPKPGCIQEARQGLETAKTELDRRYGDQRFVVDRAINLGDWESAQRELTVLLEMIPDRKDDRNREASAKLLDVEKRMKGGR